MGLQWGDIDEKACTIRIERNITYTPENGVMVSTPKTANSVHTIPIMPSTLHLLQQWKAQTEREHADIKSVQEILGHADASTTLNFYVKADLRQMQAATEKFAATFNL